MIAGKETKLSINNISLSGTKTPLSGFPRENILKLPSLFPWMAEGYSQELTLLLTTPLTLPLLTLHNVVFETSITINLFDDLDVLIHSETLTDEDLSGIKYKSLHILNSKPLILIKKITIIFTGASPDFISSIGYLWAGGIIDFGCLEKLTPSDNSNDVVTITRANTPDSQSEYLYRTYSIIIKKDNTMNSLQQNIRDILLTGYGNARPFIFNEPVFSPADCCLGIFDAGKFQYDIFIAGVDFLIQSVLGIREVF